MRPGKFKSNSGFSLIELMSATALTLVTAFAFYTVFLTIRNELAQQDNYYTGNRTIRFALDKMARDGEEAIGVVSNWAGDTTGNSILILKLPSVNASGVPTNIASQFDYVTYKLSGTTLTRTLDLLDGTSQREGGDDIINRRVATQVQSLLFTSGGTALGSIAAATLPTLKTINAQILAQAAIRGRTQTSQGDADLMLRNNVS